MRRLLSGNRGLKVGSIAIAAVTVGVAAGCSSAGTVSNAGFDRAHHDNHHVRAVKPAFSFTTIDDPADLTFNQLLGINNHGTIAGYFGSGADAAHPNKGYVLNKTRAGYTITNENFPGSVQTQVTGLNDFGVTVGFFADANGANFGFYKTRNRFTTVNFPTNQATPPVNQLLGVNNQDIAVGFYNDAAGNSHGYTFNINGRRGFRAVTIKGATSVTAAAINNRDDVAGFFTDAAGVDKSFLRTSQGRVTTLAFPAANVTATQALGVNDNREVVGVYTVTTNGNEVQHGFTWTPQRGFKSVDEPNGVNATTINGVNVFGDIVGFYTDAKGNTDGFVAAPTGQRPFPGLAPSAMPTPSASTSTSASATPTASGSTSASATPTASGSTSASATPTPSGSTSSSPAPTPSGSTSFGPHT